MIKINDLGWEDSQYDNANDASGYLHLSLKLNHSCRIGLTYILYSFQFFVWDDLVNKILQYINPYSFLFFFPFFGLG